MPYCELTARPFSLFFSKDIKTIDANQDGEFSLKEIEIQESLCSMDRFITRDISDLFCSFPNKFLSPEQKKEELCKILKPQNVEENTESILNPDNHFRIYLDTVSSAIKIYNSAPGPKESLQNELAPYDYFKFLKDKISKSFQKEKPQDLEAKFNIIYEQVINTYLPPENEKNQLANFFLQDCDMVLLVAAVAEEFNLPYRLIRFKQGYLALEFDTPKGKKVLTQYDIKDYNDYQKYFEKFYSSPIQVDTVDRSHIMSIYFRNLTHVYKKLGESNQIDLANNVTFQAMDDLAMSYYDSNPLDIIAYLNDLIDRKDPSFLSKLEQYESLLIKYPSSGVLSTVYSYLETWKNDPKEDFDSLIKAIQIFNKILKAGKFKGTTEEERLLALASTILVLGAAQEEHQSEWKIELYNSLMELHKLAKDPTQQLKNDVMIYSFLLSANLDEKAELFYQDKLKNRISRGDMLEIMKTLDLGIPL